MLTVVIFVLPFGIIKNNNSQLFRLLIKRQIPAVILRMLYNMYVSHVTCVDWNGVRSSVFSVINGVTQGGIISPILFCIYIDDLLSGLANLGAGCYIGDCYIGALAYADDIVLIAPALILCVKCYVFVNIMLLNITPCLIPTIQSAYSFLIRVCRTPSNTKACLLH